MMEALFADLLPFWGDLPGPIQSIVLGLLPAILIVLAVVTPVGILGVWGERRGSGKIQDRIGPNRVGIPFLHNKYKWARIQGLGQGLADGIKLLGKEDFVPPGGSKILFLMAPLIVFGGALALFSVLPFSEGLQAIDPELGIFVVLAVGAVEVVGVLMAGWASANKWSLLGSMREVAQVVSYEIPLSISALAPVLVAGSLQISEIVAYQQAAHDVWGLFEIPISGEWFVGWMIFHAFPFNIISFVIFYTCCLANLKRAPFDLPEAESELVAGFLTEYSGMRWSLFFLGEYGAMFAMSGFAVTLFLGGYGGPFHELFEILGGTSGEFLVRDADVLKDVIGNLAWNPQGLAAELNAAAGETVIAAAGSAEAAGLETPVFIRSLSGVIGGAIEFSWKTILFFWLMIQLRWTLPRLRIDQVMSMCYRYLIPFALVCLMFAALCGLAEGGAQ